jgi:hypothetical protein
MLDQINVQLSPLNIVFESGKIEVGAIILFVNPCFEISVLEYRKIEEIVISRKNIYSFFIIIIFLAMKQKTYQKHSLYFFG